MRNNLDTNILAAALVGYETKLETLKQQMDQVRKALRGRAPMTASAAPPVRRSRISAAGRARIAAAQRKRWAESRKAQAQ